MRRCSNLLYANDVSILSCVVLDNSLTGCGNMAHCVYLTDSPAGSVPVIFTLGA